MIIELFGPPGAGKTTFALALDRRMRESGHRTALRLSQRPTERISFGARAGPYHNVTMQRLTRPLLETLSIAHRPRDNSRHLKTAVHLVGLLPPRGFFSSVKEFQYVIRLSHSWHQNSGFAELAIFDQGFVQAVCSLALLAGGASDTILANALNYAPKSDLLIRLNAPFEILEARLKNRHRRQTAMEQKFELKIEMSLASGTIIDRLHRVLLEQGRPVLGASSLDQRSLNESVRLIENEVTKRLKLVER
jgi:hypothetical protein